MVIFSKSKLDFGIWEIFLSDFGMQKCAVGLIQQEDLNLFILYFHVKRPLLKIFRLTVWFFKQETSRNNNFVI